MRIISGEFGGIKLKPVPGKKTRPTTDKVKESLFNMIGPYFRGGNFLDLYAGSGGISLEAISRGMDKAILVDKQSAAVKTINDNIEKIHKPNSFEILQLTDNIALYKMHQLQYEFDVVFLDPPYRMHKMQKLMYKLDNFNLLKDKSIIICETDQTVELNNNIEHFNLIKQKNYGITLITIYQYINYGGNNYDNSCFPWEF